MPDWIPTGLADEGSIAIGSVALRLGAAFLLGCGVAGIYRATRRAESAPQSFPATLVLLSILIALVTQVIGDHIARAFSLVGALSIVRFRTALEDTHDIAFVIFAVVVGMAVGAHHGQVAVVGLLIVGAAAWLVRPDPPGRPWNDQVSTLVVRVSVAADPESILAGPLEAYFREVELLSGSTGKQGTALDLTYRVKLRNEFSPTQILDTFQRLEGILGVELRRS